jgi:hypothetical protein
VLSGGILAACFPVAGDLEVLRLPAPRGCGLLDQLVSGCFGHRMTSLHQGAPIDTGELVN